MTIIFVGISGGAIAQSTPSSAPVGGNSNTSDALEEITVTATRRAESVEKVPISIEALSQNDLAEREIKGIADLAAAVPSLQFEVPGAGFSTITELSIRGLNTNTGPSVVGVYLDDTPIQGRLSPVGNVGTPYPVTFDLNRVEVERGPQGTLFGAGSEAGTVRFITNQPSLTEFSGVSHAELGWTQDGSPSYELGAAAGGPIIQDKIGFRISVWDRQDGGYVNLINPITLGPVDSNVNASGKFAAKVALAFQVTDNILITPSVFYQNTHTDDSGKYYGNFSDASSGDFNDAPFFPEVASDHFTVPSLKIEDHLPFADFTSVTSYMHRNVDVYNDQSAFYGAVGAADYGNPLGSAFPTTPADVAPTVTAQGDNAFTEEVRLASNHPDAFVSWVAGAFFDNRRQADYQIAYSQVIDPSGANIYDAHQVIIDKQVAVFAQGDFHLTRQWTATLGERVARVETNQTNTNGSGVFQVGQPPIARSPTLKETPSTPRVALSFQADPNNLFYVAASKGFRVGGGNAPLPTFCGPPVPGTNSSDFVWNYEVGAKNTLFGGRVQADTSLFHIAWSKIQQLVFLPCGDQYTANAGAAASNGFDLALQALLTDRLKFGLNVGYDNAYYTESVYDQSGGPIVLAGEKIGQLPQVNSPWNVDLSAKYEFPLAQGERIYLRGEYRYHSHNGGPFITQVATSPNYYPGEVANPATNLVNARLGANINKLDVSLFVDNVFNSHPQLDSFQFAPTSNWITYNTFRPRTVGLSANLAF